MSGYYYSHFTNEKTGKVNLFQGLTNKHSFSTLERLAEQRKEAVAQSITPYESDSPRRARALKEQNP
jgi:hypothetical protein